MAESQEPRANGEENSAGDNERSKKKEKNGQELRLEIPWGQRKTGKSENLLLQCNLWCPAKLRSQGTEMRWEMKVKQHKRKAKRSAFYQQMATCLSSIYRIVNIKIFYVHVHLSW